jgi:hypothetical protein
MYIPRNWEFGPAFSKLRNFRGFEPPKHPPGYASDVNRGIITASLVTVTNNNCVS